MADKNKYAPADANKEKSKNPTEKERVINPMAIRPEGVKVTIKKTPADIEKMKKKFGF